MPGGGLREKKTPGRPGTGEAGGARWIWKSVKSPDFLFPVKLLSIRLRIAMQAHVRRERFGLYADIPECVWRREWVVHIQPAGSGRAVVQGCDRQIL